MKHEGKDFVAAVKELAAMLGMTVPQNGERESGRHSPSRYNSRFEGGVVAVAQIFGGFR